MSRSLIILATLFAFLVTFSPLRADLIEELKELEAKYAATEDDLLKRELDLDGLLEKRVEYDGVSGFFKKLLFKRKKYKALKSGIEESQAGVDSTYQTMRSVWQAIQRQLFEIAHAFETSGEYYKAIEYYRQVKPRSEREIFRIGVCYKLAGDYGDAISWFRKLNTRRDEVKFEIAESYSLWGKNREALTAYLDILEKFSNTSLEQRTLTIVEEFDYPEKDQDFPYLYRTIADVYQQRAVILHDNDFSQAVASYEKAMEYLARDYDGEPARASRAAVRSAEGSLRTAEQILDEQRYEAEEYYERKLDDAMDTYERRQREFDRAVWEAEEEFERSLRQARDWAERHRREYRRLMNEGREEEAERARQQAEHYERQTRHLIRNRQNIIEDDVRWERDRMDSAYREVRRIRANRHEIIEEYLAPYRRAVARARRYLRVVERLHETAYEGF